MTASEYEYKILGITLNDGTVIRPGKLTVLIGPNNSGKSRILKEIAAHTTVRTVPPSILVSSVDIAYPSTLAELRSRYDVERHQLADGHWRFRTLHPDLDRAAVLGLPTLKICF